MRLKVPETVVETIARDLNHGKEPREIDLQLTRWFIRRIARDLSEIMMGVSTELPSSYQLGPRAPEREAPPADPPRELPA